MMWQSSEPNRVKLWPLLRPALLLFGLAAILLSVDKQTVWLRPVRQMLHELVYQPLRVTV